MVVGEGGERDPRYDGHGAVNRVGGVVPVLLPTWMDGEPLMWTVHQRIAELWHKHSVRGLSEAETRELGLCLNANVKRAWEIAKLENLSLIASMTNDFDWLHDICRQIDELESPVTKQKKKPGRKRNTG